MAQYLLLYAVSLLFVTLGFYKNHFFYSISYGLSVAAQALVLVFSFQSSLVWLDYLYLSGWIFFGLRLSLYLFLRQSNPAYLAVPAVKQRNQRKPFNIKIQVMFWILLSFIYVAFVLPLDIFLERPKIRENGSLQGSDLVDLVALGVFWTGLIIEALADWQKAAWKNRNPQKFCRTGLFSLCRHPNYFGELMMYWGNTFLGLRYATNLVEFGLVWIGFFAIHRVIVGQGLPSLEKSQFESYGKDKRFIEYHHFTPKLIPFIW